MKTNHIVILAITLLVAASPVRAENPGDFTVESPTHGTKFTLSQQQGKVVHFPALVVLDGKGQELFRYLGKNNGDRMPTADFTAKLAAITPKS